MKKDQNKLRLEKWKLTAEQKEMVISPISDKELERRWKAVRARMKDEGIDVLLMQDNNEWLGGYVKWFTDTAGGGGYPVSVIFPKDDLMTTINHGGKPPSKYGPPPWTLRGVKQRLTAPYFSTLYYSDTYGAEEAVEALQPWKEGKIGVLGRGKIPVAFYEYLVKNLPKATFVNASDLVDQIKAIKSDEEIKLIKKTAALQDETMEYVKTLIKPGRRVCDIAADVYHKVIMLGSTGQLISAASGPLGQPAAPKKSHWQGRVVRKNDIFTIMIEVNGPGGMYTEIGRTFFIGSKAPSELLDVFELCKETQKVSLKLLKPGANPADLWDANNAFLTSHGHSPETRLYAHGQGYDLVERPAIRWDEPMTIKKNMNITVHPTIGTSRLYTWVCDNYLVTEKGHTPCLHKTPQEIFCV
jgi:Xaa-Pro aminopeptidase